MKTVKDHYDGFLGSVYSWILGDFDTAVRRSQSLFDALKLVPDRGASAVDLGCGPGCQSIPLARRGYNVLAIDFCEELIAELKEHAGSLPIRAVRDDLVAFRTYMSEPADLIVCMGDTLVHLPDEETVLRVIDEVCRSLKPGGRFIYSIRDYFTEVPEGAERFIPVRSSDDRIFTCFLDYGEDSVHVHDVMHRRTDDGWTTEISDYRKLRLAARTIERRLELGGLSSAPRLTRDGMITGVATRPS